MIHVDFDICSGCGLCEKKCLFNAITMADKYPLIGDGCVYCGLCRDSCPKGAISVDIRTQFSKDDFAGYTGIWTVMQLDSVSQNPKKVSFELLSEARKLGERLKQKISAVCLCKFEPKGIREALSEVGCDELLLLRNDLFENYNNDIFTGIIAGLISRRKPGIVLFPATEDGRDLAPRVAGRLRVGLTADCTALDIDGEGRLVQIRPTYGGNIMASIITPYHRPQMASIRPNVFKVETYNKKTRTEVIELDFQVDPGAVRVKRAGVKQKEMVYKDVSEAEIIIAGGYGVGKENFKLLHELAIKTGAAVGATRKAVDEGWAPFDIQIGQTGKTVAPALYIACGISGALQHSIGVKNSRKIISVNNDPVAPIFSMSDVSILGDVRQILQELIVLADKQGEDTFRVL
jgi:electron transfer flavoprotein alpha subunit